MLVVEGTGMRFVVDSMERSALVTSYFRAQTSRTSTEKDSTLRSKATVVYFKENFLGDAFWDLPDVSPIKKAARSFHPRHQV